MNKGEFLHLLQGELALANRDEAEKVAICVLGTLANRLTTEEAENVEAQLPEGIKAMWRGNLGNVLRHRLEGAQKFSREDFVAHVVDDLKVPQDRAIALIEGVFTVLKHQITPGLADHLQSQLPKGLRVMWLESKPVEEVGPPRRI
ncbi:MAG TPA: DUF2267 domain-containing protein [Oscillatoriaceae cyanobacterium]